jgi:predicted nucleic acid-binding protein
MTSAADPLFVDTNILVYASWTATLLPQASGVRVHDVNIVATMQTGGVQHLLTNNLSDFAPFSHLITVLPVV